MSVINIFSIFFKHFEYLKVAAMLVIGPVVQGCAEIVI